MPDHASPPKSGRKTSTSAAGIWGAALLAFWLCLSAYVLYVTELTELTPTVIAVLVIALALPAVVIALALVVAQSTAALRAEAARVQGAVDDIRSTLLAHANAPAPLPPEAQSRLDALSHAQQQTDSQISIFTSSRVPQQIPFRSAQTPTPPDQSLLALGPEHLVGSCPPDPVQLIRALHFPENAEDTEGFEALRRALSDPATGRLIRAAQDVLTRLSQDGIYMDDLRPDRARPEFWRAFAQGRRGAEIAPLGGVRDRSCLALTAGRLRSDPGFREAAHVFLREFDRVFSTFEGQADDAQIAAFAETRSARAFMLLGRVTGVFSR